MNSLVVYLIRILFHLVIMLGVWQVIQPTIEELINRSSQKNEFHKEINEKLLQAKTKKKTSRKKSSTISISNHLEKLLYLVKNDYKPKVSIIRFYTQTLFFFLAAFFVTAVTMKELPNHLTFNNPFAEGIQFDNDGLTRFNWKFSLFMSVIISCLPYIRLRYNYSLKSVQASYDLLEVVKIYSKYTYLSIDRALDETSKAIENANVLKRPLRILSDAFANYPNETALQFAANRFADVISTFFARVFVSDLLYAEREGSAVLSSSLLELNMSMEQQRETIISVKAANRDPITLGLYVNVIVLVGVVGTFCVMLGFGIYYKLQFQTKEGLYFLAFIVATLFLAFAISIILSRPKLDYQ